jgi:hypothetical protein
MKLLVHSHFFAISIVVVESISKEEAFQQAVRDAFGGEMKTHTA